MIQADKITLDLTDNDELKEFFSRKAPGDKVEGRFEATLDEAAEKVANQPNASSKATRVVAFRERRNRKPFIAPLRGAGLNSLSARG